MPVARRRPRKLGAAFRTVRFGRRAGLLALVTEQVAEGGELAAVAAMLPALRFGSLVEHANRGGRLAAERLGHGRIGVHVTADVRRRVAHALLLAGSIHRSCCGSGVVRLAVHPRIVEIG